MPREAEKGQSVREQAARMCEYQRYERMTSDRPLTRTQLEAVNSLSGDTEVSSTHVLNDRLIPRRTKLLQYFALPSRELTQRVDSDSTTVVSGRRPPAVTKMLRTRSD